MTSNEANPKVVNVPGWLVLVYRVPSEPASKRVSVWRDLKRLGGLYLQQCVCVLPRFGSIVEAMDQIIGKIDSLDGMHTLLEVPRLGAEDESRVIAAFRDLRNKEYAEIVEECETKFVKEVEFERFRENYSFGEAEEIQQDLEKIRRWFEVVKERDWFGASREGDVTVWLDRCTELLERFEEEVYHRNGSDHEAGGLASVVSPSAHPREIPTNGRSQSATSRKEW